MEKANSSNRLAHSFWPVKSQDPIIIGTPPDSMIHHKVALSKSNKMIVSYSGYRGNTYGVSRAQQLLSPALFIKKFDYIRDCLKYVLELPNAQRETCLRLVRLAASYEAVYPKASQIAELPGCSKATFWRTIRRLRELGLIDVVNRYVVRPHAQISNLYLLDGLIILLARYLAEHTARLWPDWLDTWLEIPWPKLWEELQSVFHPPGEPLPSP